MNFLMTNRLKLMDYGVDFEKLDWSLFYFTHRKEGCFSTFALEAKDFLDLYSGTKYAERRTGHEDCPGYCLEEEQLNRCDALCECAFNREIIKIIKDRHSKITYQHNLPADGCSRKKGGDLSVGRKKKM